MLPRTGKAARFVPPHFTLQKPCKNIGLDRSAIVYVVTQTTTVLHRIEPWLTASPRNRLLRSHPLLRSLPRTQLLKRIHESPKKSSPPHRLTAACCTRRYLLPRLRRTALCPRPGPVRRKRVRPEPVRVRTLGRGHNRFLIRLPVCRPVCRRPPAGSAQYPRRPPRRRARPPSSAATGIKLNTRYLPSRRSAAIDTLAGLETAGVTGTLQHRKPLSRVLLTGTGLTAHFANAATANTVQHRPHRHTDTVDVTAALPSTKSP